MKACLQIKPMYCSRDTTFLQDSTNSMKIHLKYEILPQVVIPNIPTHMKYRKLDNIPNTIQHTVPMTPPNTLSKATLHNIITKTPVSTIPRSKFATISKQEVIYNFHNEIDDAELMEVDCD